MVLLDDGYVPPLLVDDDGEFNTSHWFQVRDEASSELELELAASSEVQRAHTAQAARHPLWTYAYGNVPPPPVITCDNHSSHHTTATISLMAMATEVMRGPIHPCNSNPEEGSLRDSSLSHAGWAFAWAFFQMENF